MAMSVRDHLDDNVGEPKPTVGGNILRLVVLGYVKQLADSKPESGLVSRALPCLLP